MMTRWLGISISAFLLSGSCLAEELAPVSNPDDPYEPFNRAVYHFNDAVDRAVLKPAATLYNKIMPKPLNKGISNIFANLDNLPTIANDLLQANFYQATNDTWRLAINSTAGLVGFFDVATYMGLERHSEDLGLTLAHWGYKDSAYLVLPFLGPSTIRDAISWPVNYEFFTIYPYVHPTRLRYEVYAVNLLSTRAELLRYQNVFQQAAVDKYVFVRNAYLQRRAYQIERNKELDS